MADIIEKLHDQLNVLERNGWDCAIQREAAKEIEGLRTINERLMSRLGRITDYADIYSETVGEPEFTYLTTIAAWGNEAVKWACQKENELPSRSPLPADAVLDLPQLITGTHVDERPCDCCDGSGMSLYWHPFTGGIKAPCPRGCRPKQSTR